MKSFLVIFTPRLRLRKGLAASGSNYRDLLTSPIPRDQLYQIFLLLPISSVYKLPSALCLHLYSRLSKSTSA
jgi:hypothetical protein